MVSINNSINDQVGGSNSGVTNTLTIDNASNTASSQALLNVTVGGTSAGDAFQTFTVAGTTNWSQGVDNSDSDAYVVSASTALGTTNVIRAQTTGEINYPLQPAILVQLAANANNVIGNVANAYKILFDTEVFDQNNDYASSDFTAPVTGLYLMSSGVSVQQITSLMVNASLRIVTSNRTIINQDINPGAARTVAGTADLVTFVAGYLQDLDAGDTSHPSIKMDGGAAATADIIGGTSGSYFGGLLSC